MNNSQYCKLQERTIQEFKSFYPNLTLNNISDLTDIQMTRVFRLFNGAKMKLEEYEKFKSLIIQKKSNNTELHSLILKLEKIANSTTLSDIVLNISRKIQIIELKQAI